MNQKRDKFIKVMLTENEYNNIERYSHIEFENKSEFIREAVKMRIEHIKDQIEFHKEERMKNGNLRSKILKETQIALETHGEGSLLKNPDKNKLERHQTRLERRKQELKKELKKIEQELTRS